MGSSPRDNLILVADDDPNVVKLFSLYLRDEGYDVAVAASGEDALEAAEILDPAAIILDLLLPAMDGWEVLTELKSSPLTRHIPVVIASVLDRQALGFHLGAVEHLVKPVDRDRLLHALERSLLRHRFRERAPRVLVVHDEEEELHLLATLLAQEGYDVLAAHGCTEAIAMARAFTPDLAVLDLMLAEREGRRVIAGLQADGVTAAIPVLLVARRGIPAPGAQKPQAENRSIVMEDEVSASLLLKRVGHLLLESRR